ncbi:hypothetical protein EON66_05305, partial [archaeon]
MVCVCACACVYVFVFDCVRARAGVQVSTPNGDITVTNDGATILRSIIVDNPAAKVLVDIAKTQDEEVGDGTTSVTVLTGELLREAERLINMRVHPMIIIDGWRRATAVARAALEASSLDHASDPALFEADLLNIARTTLSSKLLTHEKDMFGMCLHTCVRVTAAPHPICSALAASIRCVHCLSCCSQAGCGCCHAHSQVAQPGGHPDHQEGGWLVEGAYLFPRPTPEPPAASPFLPAVYIHAHVPPLCAHTS